MEGSIDETRNKINTKKGTSYIVKSLNFLGDQGNNLTEICVPQKYARWIISQISKVKKDERVIGDHYGECYQFVPR